MSIPGNVVKDMTELSESVLSDNLLQTLPRGLLRTLKQLRKVNLGNNRLNSLPEDLFQDLPVLSHVYLNDNRLPKLTWNIFLNSGQVKYIDLSNNMFHILEQFEIPDTFVEIRLDGNPVSCSREMCWLFFHDALTLSGSCHSPANLEGKEFHQLASVDIGCSGKLWAMSQGYYCVSQYYDIKQLTF